MSVKELEDLRGQIRKFLTILFFEPFTFAICGPKPSKWTGHALGLVLGSAPILILITTFFRGYVEYWVGDAWPILWALPIFAFVVGRVVAVIFLLRILKAFGAAGVKEFGVFQIMYKIHDFFGNIATFRRGGVDWRIPYVADICEALALFPLLPLVWILIIPAVGSFCMHKMHKKLLAILTTIQIKEVT